MHLIFLLLPNQWNDIKHLFKLMFFKRAIDPVRTFFLNKTPEGFHEIELSSCPSFAFSFPLSSQAQKMQASVIVIYFI